MVIEIPKCSKGTHQEVKPTPKIKECPNCKSKGSKYIKMCKTCGREYCDICKYDEGNWTNLCEYVTVPKIDPDGYTNEK